MKHCPKCQSRYPDNMVFCLIDGEPLAINDPEATTLQGEVEIASPVSSMCDAFQLIVGLKVDKPYTFVHPEITVILVLKQIEWMGTSPEMAALIAFYGDFPLQHGAKVKANKTEFLMPVNKDNEPEVSVFYYEFFEDCSKLFRVYVHEITSDWTRAKVNLAFSVTKPASPA